jgi:vacuolar-type H+-ATPase subunit H
MSAGNPIEQVLRAEREASDQIERERAQAARALSDARLWARRFMRRTEERLQKAAARYEQRCGQQRDTEVQVLRERDARETRRRRADTEKDLAQTVDDVLERHWPAGGED